MQFTDQSTNGTKPRNRISMYQTASIAKTLISSITHNSNADSSNLVFYFDVRNCQLRSIMETSESVPARPETWALAKNTKA